MIELSEEYFIGQGTNRACYQHPNDKDKCIKVTISGNFSESNKEKEYYSFLKKKNISWENIAQYYGILETNMGEGLVFELIRDTNGEVSKPLSYYFSSEKLTLSLDEPMKKLQFLKQYLLNEKVIVKDLGVSNILYQKIDNNDKLVIIDGVLNNDFIPIATYIGYFTKRKIQRRWRSFIKHFSKYAKKNKVLEKMYMDNPF